MHVYTERVYTTIGLYIWTVTGSTTIQYYILKLYQLYSCIALT